MTTILAQGGIAVLRFEYPTLTLLGSFSPYLKNSVSCLELLSHG